ncbi:tyrosine-type recombinase/integrase [Notoacmeibacter ruber]|uniref:Tyr recombinase domain-containing protein n=1 Tax=Notoacmeibacter ruber TaxID=2670375 RepID=A0A3L7JAA6_9HYPH|nr:tyrosine-type recombinase/integrase [Notoacmeibacter ruber]RLQ87389.1 hypothetical protein D8780_03385 [Notoacmeibacter ruber]
MPNLTRRGRRHYWRARIPRRAAAQTAAGRQHFTLPIRISDLAAVEIIALDLNRLLHAMRQDETMTLNAEQMQTIFKAEIADMEARHATLRLGARHCGFGSESEALIDAEVGHAYKLIALFGAHRRLTFEGPCPGLAYLQASGVQPDRHPWIVSTYEAERACALSSGGREETRALLRSQNLPVGTMALEAAQSAVMDARATQLLSTRSAYPDLAWFDGADIDDAQKETSVPTSDVPTHPAVESQSDQRSDLEVADMEEWVGRYLKGRKDIEDATKRDIGVAVTFFAETMTAEGLKRLSEVRQQTLGAFRNLFDEILTNYGRSARLRTLSATELRMETRRQVREAEEAGKPLPPVGLSGQTIRKHIGSIEQFLGYLEGQGFIVPPRNWKSLRPKKKKGREARAGSPKPGSDRVGPVFELPPFTGCASPGQLWSTGSRIFHGSLFYVPQMIYYLGVRRGEVCGLDVDDLVQWDGGLAIKIRPNAGRRLKNENSIRILPLHSEIARLGIWSYADAVRATGSTKLFPELYPALPRPGFDPGDRFYKDFVGQAKAALANRNLEAWQRFIHALRHGNATALKELGVDQMLIDEIAGRAASGETAGRYTQRASLQRLSAVIERIPVVTGHLSPQPISLLPWVTEKSKRPWERST